MTPYPHPLKALAIFQARLSLDIGADNTSYTLQCAAPIPTSVGLATSSCASEATEFNSMVDIQATGAIEGEVDGYLYNRIDITRLALPDNAFDPFLKGTAVTSADLLTQINARWGTSLDVTDIQAYPLPVCECACGPIGFVFQIAPSSLLYIGTMTLYLVDDVALPSVILQPFLPNPILPALTP
jgi:hypothetical protein